MRKPTANRSEAAAPAGRFRAFLDAEAARLGFAAVGVAPARLPVEAGRRLRAAIGDGHMGAMDWMATTLERRVDPTAMWPAARTAIVLAATYAPDEDPRRALANRMRGVVSVYAARRDYHDVVKGRLKDLAGRLVARARALGLGDGPEVKVFVDTAPLLEKPLAAVAGLGWQGKHTNLVSRAAGSWTFLGTILTDLDLAADTPGIDRCGSCRACLDACPTDAFPAPYRLDARRCVSYLTIEHPGPIPRDLRAGVGNRIFGCDDCLAACPWNKFAVAARDVRLALRDDLRAVDLATLAALDDAAFRERFAGTPVKRIGRDRFLRNVQVAIGNSGAPTLLPAVRDGLDDRSALVRGAAVWALARLDPAGFGAARAARLPAEADPDVRVEWQTSPSDP